MLDQKPGVPPDGEPSTSPGSTGTSPATQSAPANIGPIDAEDTGEYFDPEGHSEPLVGRSQSPQVKRFNRKTVAVLLVALVLVGALAFATALTRRQPVITQESAAQKTPASSTATDSINALPSNYSQIKRPPPLGQPVPGDIGAIAQAAGVQAGQQQPAGSSGPRALTPLEQYEAQQALERAKRADRAREGGFTFVNGGSGGTTASGAEQIADAQRAITAGVQGGGLASPARPGLLPVVDGASRTSRDDDNRQDDKSRFLNDRSNRFDLNKPQMEPRSPFTIFASAIIPGVLITGINSDLPGQIKGQISQNVYDTVTGQYLLLPQGSMILGQYDSRVTYGQSRVLIVWTRIVRPDGSNIDLETMPGVDLSGYAGLTGDVDRHVWRLLTAVVLGSVIQAGTQAGSSTGGFGSSQSFSDSARQGLGSGVNDATQQIVRKELQLQPTIKVPPGERFNIFLTKDIVMTPYKS